MVFSRCLKCNILSSIFIFLICATLYKKYTINSLKENLKIPLLNEKDISDCEKTHFEKLRSSTSVNFGNNQEARTQCLNFLNKKCNFKNCKKRGGITVNSFDMKNHNDGITYAQNCGNMCRSRCTYIENCARMKSNKKNPYNITEQSDSQNE
jgi:hypothetical protein